IELVLEAFDGYWRKTPAVKRLVLRSIPDESTRAAALKRGEVDIAYFLNGPIADDVRRTAGLTLSATRTNGVLFLMFPDQWTAGSPWADRRRPAGRPPAHHTASHPPHRRSFPDVPGSVDSRLAVGGSAAPAGRQPRHRSPGHQRGGVTRLLRAHGQHPTASPGVRARHPPRSLRSQACEGAPRR